MSTGVPCRGSSARLATGVCGLFQLPGQAPQNPSIMTFSTGFQPSLGHLLRIYPGIQNFWIMEPGSHIQKSRISGFLDIPKSLGPPSLIPHISRHPEFLDYGTRFTYPEIQNFWITEPGSHIQRSRISGFLDIPKSLGPPSLIPHISRHPEFLDYGTFEH